MPARNTQFTTPSVVTAEGRTHALKRLSVGGSSGDARSEDWLQETIFKSPSLLPIDEIEPTFSGALPLCRELPTAVGPLDLLLINEQGLLTLVECKLWRNPEARRKVVGQILDYAQEVSRWDYDQLDAAIRRATKETVPLWERAKAAFGLVDEAQFIDRVSRNLRQSRFLLLIVGDGIRETTEQIGNYLKAHAGLSFTLGLVEQQLFQLPDGQGILVQPRILAKTVELGRLIVRSESGRVEVEDDVPQEETHAAVPRTLTEKVFVEEVAGSSALAGQLQQFFDDLKRQGLSIQPTARGNSMKVCSPELNLNLLSFKRSGVVKNYAVGEAVGGHDYITRLAAVLPQTTVRQSRDSGWRTTVEKTDGTPVKIEDVLAVRAALTVMLVESAAQLDRLNQESALPEGKDDPESN